MKYHLLSAVYLGIFFTASAVLPTIASSQGNIQQFDPESRVQSVPVENLADLVDKARDKIKKGDYQGARTDLNKAIELSPNNPKLFAMRGLVYAGLERYERAIQDYSECLRLDPKNTAVYTLRGDAHWNIRQYAAAIDDYGQVIQLTPQSSLSYIKRASAYRALKETEKALADLNQAVKINPQDPEPYNIRGEFYASIFIADKTTSRTPLPFSYNLLEDMKQKALSDYGQAIKLNSRGALYYYNRGILHAAILNSFSGDILRVFDRGPEKQRAINDLRMAAKLFADAGQKDAAQAALNAIQRLP
jgi:tetratricopeptide (TPR) repeat protein